MTRTLDTDMAELLFRLFFSSIFLVLGAEHLFHDQLIQALMPEWLPLKRLCSVASGVILLAGGGSIALGVELRRGALLLGVFLILVTALIHIPGMLITPESVAADDVWLWDLYQRSNFIKNVCLLGVCLHLLTHEPGRHTLPSSLRRRARRGDG